jgi:hypothetical protein
MDFFFFQAGRRLKTLKKGNFTMSYSKFSSALTLCFIAFHTKKSGKVESGHYFKIGFIMITVSAAGRKIFKHKKHVSGKVVTNRQSSPE